MEAALASIAIWLWSMTSRMVDDCRRGVEQLGSSLGS
jgi:hypothetical protein